MTWAPRESADAWRDLLVTARRELPGAQLAVAERPTPGRVAVLELLVDIVAVLERRSPETRS